MVENKGKQRASGICTLRGRDLGLGRSRTAVGGGTHDTVQMVSATKGSFRKVKSTSVLVRASEEQKPGQT